MKNFQILFLLLVFTSQAQQKPTINKDEIIRIETELASDKMQ